MAQKPHIQFDKLFQKLYNTELWLMAYQQIAPKEGNMTPGVDGKTIDGTGMELITEMIGRLKSSSYKPTPVSRTYVPKPDGSKRPIGIPSFQDKLLQTVVRLILESIYEPTFSDNSHGFRPERSCHTALEQVKRMPGVRWWVEGDIKGFFDNLHHDTLLRILSKRITDKRFLHLIQQFLKAGYIEDWEFNKTYSGTPQGGPLSPLLSNIYLNELDKWMARKIAVFNKGKRRKITAAYHRGSRRRKKAKVYGRETGDWSQYKAEMRASQNIPFADPQDPSFRRMYYCRYVDDFVVAIIGSKEDAERVKAELAAFLREKLYLELSMKKTLITNAKDRVRFLGYDIKRWQGERRVRYRTKRGQVITRRSCTYHLQLLIPRDKCHNFVREYGNPSTWRGASRGKLYNLSELEILKIYNSEIRGFLNYYALADNFGQLASRILWVTTSSFFRTLAAKRRSTLKRVARSLKRGANHYVISVEIGEGKTREYRLVSSPKQIQLKKVTWDIDRIPNIYRYQGKTELGKRLQANQCEWCGTRQGYMEVHHVRKLANLKGKTIWERRMIERRRKTMVLCKRCHVDLHAGRLTERNRLGKAGEPDTSERGTSGSEGGMVKPNAAMD